MSPDVAVCSLEIKLPPSENTDTVVSNPAKLAPIFSHLPSLKPPSPHSSAKVASSLLKPKPFQISLFTLITSTCICTIFSAKVTRSCPLFLRKLSSLHYLSTRLPPFPRTRSILSSITKYLLVSHPPLGSCNSAVH